MNILQISHAKTQTVKFGPKSLFQTTRKGKATWLYHDFLFPNSTATSFQYVTETRHNLIHHQIVRIERNRTDKYCSIAPRILQRKERELLTSEQRLGKKGGIAEDENGGYRSVLLYLRRSSNKLKKASLQSLARPSPKHGHPHAGYKDVFVLSTD